MGRLFTGEEKRIRRNRRIAARFILRAANPPADMVELAHRTLAELAAEEAERRALRSVS